MAHSIKPLALGQALVGESAAREARPAGVQRGVAGASSELHAPVSVADGRHRDQFLSAVQIAQKHGLSYQTVNYYTNLGLLVAVKRQGHHRLYDIVQTEQRLREVESLKSQGYPLKLISQKLSSFVSREV